MQIYTTVSLEDLYNLHQTPNQSNIEKNIRRNEQISKPTLERPSAVANSDSSNINSQEIFEMMASLFVDWKNSTQEIIKTVDKISANLQNMRSLCAKQTLGNKSAIVVDQIELEVENEAIDNQFAGKIHGSSTSNLSLSFSDYKSNVDSQAAIDEHVSPAIEYQHKEQNGELNEVSPEEIGNYSDNDWAQSKGIVHDSVIAQIEKNWDVGFLDYEKLAKWQKISRFNIHTSATQPGNYQCDNIQMQNHVAIHSSVSIFGQLKYMHPELLIGDEDICFMKGSSFGLAKTFDMLFRLNTYITLPNDTRTASISFPNAGLSFHYYSIFDLGIQFQGKQQQQTDPNKVFDPGIKACFSSVVIVLNRIKISCLWVDSSSTAMLLQP